MGVIYCIGENLEQKDADTEQTYEVIANQLLAIKDKMDPTNWQKVVIAYEPIWAIGTGKTATPSQAQEVHKFIRHQLAKCIGLDESKKMRIVYGGSVKPENAKALLEQPDVDGGLVGGASLVGSDFFSIIQSCS